MNDNDLLIPLKEDSKRPFRKFGGWPIALDHANVFTRFEVRKSGSEWWALVESTYSDLLVIDVDDPELTDDISTVMNDVIPGGLEQTRIVRTQSGMFHIYVRLLRDDVELRAVDGIDLKGETQKGYVLDPEFCDEYEVVNETEPAFIDPSDLVDTNLFYEKTTPSSPIDPETYTPERSIDELADLESTSDLQDIYDAISHTTYGDFELVSPQTEGGTSHEERKSFDPCWTESESGTRLGHDGGSNFIDRSNNVSLDALQVVAHEDGILQPGDESTYPSGPDFFEAVDAFRDRGASIPRYEPTTGPIGLPKVRGMPQDEKHDHLIRDRAKQRVNDILDSSLDGNIILYAPFGVGKTRAAVSGAEHKKRLILTGNKGEHRNSAKYFAQEAGLSCVEVIPFEDSWLASSASPVQDDALDLLCRGFAPKYIMELYGHLVPQNADTPYHDQFDSEITADVLLGTPGHENVERFREDREVIYDDTHPVAEQIVENGFTIESTQQKESSRPELNALIRNIDELDSSCLEDLLRNPADQKQVQRLKPGTITEESGAETVGELLDERTTGPGIKIALIDIAQKEPLVRGDTLLKLKIVCGMEATDRTVPIRTSTGWYSYATLPPVHDHNVAILSGTPIPHVSQHFFDIIGVQYAYETVTSDMRAYWRARNLTVIRTSRHQHARSGGNVNVERTKHLQDAIERLESTEVPVIDSKKALDKTGQNGVNFARTPSNNDLQDDHVGQVNGCTYYGDEYVELIAAFCSEDITIEHPKGSRATCDSDVGRDLLQWMKQAPVAQAIGRFGRRDPDTPTRVYVDTDEIPHEFPVVDITEEIVELTTTERDAYNAIADGAETANKIHGQVDVESRQVRNVIRSLEEKGLVQLSEYGTSNGEHVVSAVENPFGNDDIRITIRRLPNDTRNPPSGPQTGTVRSTESTEQVKLGDIEVDNPQPG